jgi:hypothetical protein
MQDVGQMHGTVARTDALDVQKWEDLDEEGERCACIVVSA